MEQALMAVGMIAALYGIGDWIWRLVTCWLFSKQPSGEWVVVPLHGDAVTAEFAVRRWLSSRERVRCLLVDCGLTDRGKQLAERVSVTFSLPLCAVEDLSEFVTNGLQSSADDV